MSYDYDYLYKLVLIGDSGVGKSSIIMQYVDGIYDDIFISTIGVDFKTHTVHTNDKITKIQIWDTAGQDRFRSITNSYYRGANCIIIVFDVTDINTFHNVNKWLIDIKKYNNTNHIYLIGNKSDMEKNREVEYDVAMRYATKNDMLYFETSAKKNVNLNDTFIKIVQKLIESNNSSNYSVNDKQIILNSSPKNTNYCCFN